MLSTPAYVWNDSPRASTPSEAAEYQKKHSVSSTSSHVSLHDRIEKALHLKVDRQRTPAHGSVHNTPGYVQMGYWNEKHFTKQRMNDIAFALGMGLEKYVQIDHSEMYNTWSKQITFF